MEKHELEVFDDAKMTIRFASIMLVTLLVFTAGIFIAYEKGRQSGSPQQQEQPGQVYENPQVNRKS